MAVVEIPGTEIREKIRFATGEGRRIAAGVDGAGGGSAERGIRIGGDGGVESSLGNDGVVVGEIKEVLDGEMVAGAFVVLMSIVFFHYRYIDIVVLLAKLISFVCIYIWWFGREELN